MKEFKENIAQFSVLEWRGARIKVEIEVPWKDNSMVLQNVIDDRELMLLRDLHMPGHIDMLQPDQRHFKIVRWEQKRKQAENVRDRIAMQIAQQITFAIGEEV